MSVGTKIEWADMSFNPWRGCEKVSPGCKNCYAEHQARRNPGVLGQWGPGRISVRGAEGYLQMPYKWSKLAGEGRFVECLVCRKREFRRRHSCGRNGELQGCSGQAAGCVAPEAMHESMPVRPRVFCLSFGDWLDPHVPIEWLAELLETIRTTPHLDWLLLTKRPEFFPHRLGHASVIAGESGNVQMEDWLDAWVACGAAPVNVWCGVSVEDQRRADERIPSLLATPARVRFLSCEPLLEPVELWNHRISAAAGETANQAGIDWVILGGESGPGARPCALEWIDDVRRQCEAAEVPCFVKQLGSAPYVENANLWDWPLPLDEDEVYTDLPASLNCQAHAAAGVQLRHKKGGDWAEWPKRLRVRNFPALHPIKPST